MEMCPLAGKCPPLKGIHSVKSSCASRPTAPGGQCQLECEQNGLQLTDESFANLICKEDKNGPSWYKENGKKVTLKEIKSMELCNSNVCPIISGVENVKTNCSTEPSRKGDICLLECEEAGKEITEKEYKKLKCRRIYDPATGEDMTEWHTMNNVMVTVDELKSKDLCPGDGDSCPKIDGIKNVKVECTTKECKLECEQSGVKLTKEEYKILFCKMKDGKRSWYTKSDVKVTPEELKNMDLCPG